MDISLQIFTANKVKAGWIPDENEVKKAGRGTYNYLFGHLETVVEWATGKKIPVLDIWEDECGKDDSHC